MDANPHGNPGHHYHHQQHHPIPGHHVGIPANGGGYPAVPGPSMDDRGNCSRGGMNASPGHLHSVCPTNSWQKTSPGPTASLGGSNCCPSPNVTVMNTVSGGIPSTGAYGAGNSNFTSQGFYPEQDVHYSSSTSGNNVMNPSRSNQGFPSMDNSGMQQQYYNNDNTSAASESSCYYQQQQHHTGYSCDQQNNAARMIKNSSICDSNNSNSASSDLQQTNGNENTANNFYNYYPSHPQYHHHAQQSSQSDYQHHNNKIHPNARVASVNGGGEGDYSGFHHHNFNVNSTNVPPNGSHHHRQQNVHQNQQQAASSTIACQGQSYFGMFGNRTQIQQQHQHQQSYTQHQQQHPHHPQHQQNQQQTPFRRNSIESYSPEPGELPYNSKYGCNFANTPPPGISNIPFNDVIKRETTNVAPIHNSPANTSSWAPEPDLNAVNHQDRASQNYFLNNRNTSTPTTEHTFQNQHLPQHSFQQNFKSCSYDMSQSDSASSSVNTNAESPKLEAQPSNPSVFSSVKHSGLSASNQNQPGSAVKHRSLSCSVMTSASGYQFSASSSSELNFNFLGTSSNSNSSNSGNLIESSNKERALERTSCQLASSSSVPADGVTSSEMEITQTCDLPSAFSDCHSNVDPQVKQEPMIKEEKSESMDITSAEAPVKSDAPPESQNASFKSSPLATSDEKQSEGAPTLAGISSRAEVSESQSNSDQVANPASVSIEKTESEKDFESLVISTTTNGSDENSCLSVDPSRMEEDSKLVNSKEQLPEDDDGCNDLLDALNEADVSNSSCSLSLFVNNTNSDSNTSLVSQLAITTGTNDGSCSEDNESCHSGVSSLSGNHKTLSDICISEFSRHQTLGGGKNGGSAPQKISKRSFSEADKDLVINTTAVSFRNNIIVPQGWKREISSPNNKSEIQTVLYTSPSGTKLRTWDELKNYICSNGTCKCGLSCPLRLEQSFSFDPKVTNALEEEEAASKRTGSEGRLLCNHKRKIPKSEDSPLISSTRDDLGDCGDNGGSAKKKRRISEGGDVDSSKVPVPQISPPVSANTRSGRGGSVSVPFSQQSPDTTTQTPQTEMSPASSVSSEPSVFGGSRSTSSTPTPMSAGSISSPGGSGGKNSQAKSGGKSAKDNKLGWPQVPTSLSLSTSPVTSAIGSSISPTTTTMTFWSSTGPGNTVSTSAITPVSAAVKTGESNSKKHSSGMATPKGVLISKKRANSPCPNIDVRQIPLEQNRPPPRPNQIQITALSSAPSQSLSADNTGVTLFPITSRTPPVENTLLNLNTGYSISPILSTSSQGIGTMSQSFLSNTLQFTTSPSIQAPTLLNSNVSILPLPLQFQRIQSAPVMSSGITQSLAPANTLIHQSLPSSITISMVGGNSTGASCLPLINSSQITTNPVSVTTQSKTSAVPEPTASNKSHLQLVQDVVDRFQSSKAANNKQDEIKEGSTISPAVPSATTPLDIKVSLADVKIEPVPVSCGSAVEDVQNASVNIKSEKEEPGGTQESVAKSTVQPPMDDVKVIIASSTAAPVEISISEAKKISGMTQPSVSCITTTSTSQLSALTTTQSLNVQPVVASSPIMSSAPSTSVVAMRSSNSPMNAQPQQIILQQSSGDMQQNTFMNSGNGQANSQPLRYPFFQTIQPIFLNSTGGQGGQLILAPQGTGQPGESQSFIYEQQPQLTSDPQMQPLLQQTTMVLDPNVCGNAAGSKKKKKRLSKKQQQQQAQLQLQQQLLLQQIAQQQAQQQVAQAQQQFPLTIFPQSFNLGHQGFSLQPMNMNMNMNFFPTSNIMTLPNLISLPDGTLFLQPSQQLQTTGPTQPQMKLGQFPIVAGPNSVVVSSAQGMQQQQGNLIAPKKEGGMNSNITLLSDQVTLIKTGPASADVMSDDSRQNPTPDSSTNDCQLGLNLNPITISLPQLTSNNAISIGPLSQNNKKLNAKSRAVSSSTGGGTQKRIFPQKQILPKIDSTTPTVENS